MLDSTQTRHSNDDFAMVEHEDAANPYLSSISSYIDKIHDELRRISLEIHDYPELQYKEFHAHEVLTRYLSGKSGWKVTPSAYDIATAFVAVYDSGKKGPVASNHRNPHVIRMQLIRRMKGIVQCGIRCTERHWTCMRP